MAVSHEMLMQAHEQLERTMKAQHEHVGRELVALHLHTEQAAKSSRDNRELLIRIEEQLKARTNLDNGRDKAFADLLAMVTRHETDITTLMTQRGMAVGLLNSPFMAKLLAVVLAGFALLYGWGEIVRAG